MKKDGEGKEGIGQLLFSLEVSGKGKEEVGKEGEEKMEEELREKRLKQEQGKDENQELDREFVVEGKEEASQRNGSWNRVWR